MGQWLSAQAISCLESLSLARKPTLPPSWVSWVSWVSWSAHQKMKSLAGGPPTPSGTPYGPPPLTGNAAILAAHDWESLRPMFSPFRKL